MIRRFVGFLEERVGTSPLIRKALRYAFPDHWSFMLGEIALYCFFVLVATGIYLTFFFTPSYQHVIYHGRYHPLDGVEMTKAYLSTLQISFAVKAGLLIRQTHHWAANVFVAAIVLHMMRIFFTGAFRKPRDINAWVGTTMLALAALEGYGRKFAEFCADYDLVLTPALARLPVSVGWVREPDDPWEQYRRAGDFTPFTPPVNVAGLPAAAVPFAWTDDGIPVGIHLIGRYGDEATLLRVSAQIEQAQPWADRRPPLAA